MVTRALATDECWQQSVKMVLYQSVNCIISTQAPMHVSRCIQWTWDYHVRIITAATNLVELIVILWMHPLLQCIVSHHFLLLIWLYRSANAVFWQQRSILSGFMGVLSGLLSSCWSVLAFCSSSTDRCVSVSSVGIFVDCVTHGARCLMASFEAFKYCDLIGRWGSIWILLLITNFCWRIS